LGSLISGHIVKVKRIETQKPLEMGNPTLNGGVAYS
jgi:hypothetical protein